MGTPSPSTEEILKEAGKVKIINVDLDGVVDDFHAAFDAAYYWNGTTKSPLSKADQWESWNNIGVSRGQFNSLIRRGVLNGSLWWNDPVIDGAKEYLWRLSDDGYDIRIVTTRLVHKFGHATTIEATANWLEKNDIPYRTICFLGPGEEKGMFFADYGIDDNIGNVMSMRRRDVDAVIFNRPWNQHSPLPRVKTWKEFYEYVTKV
jgi:5'(3')-deoxyribonucleotidase